MHSNSLSTHVDRAAAGSGKIAVVIPAYNASAYLPATLQSVLDQSAAPGEVIVVDDGSTDETAAIARSFGVRVISQDNRGLSAARNVGTHAARGEYIAYLDADDLWAPDKLAVQLAALEAFAVRAFSFTDYRIFDAVGIRARLSELRYDRAFRRTAASSIGENRLIAGNGETPVLSDCYILPSSLLVRRADVLAIGGFDETVTAAEDYEFFLRLFKIMPAVAVMQPLLLYRRHAQQATANTTKMKAGLIDVGRRVAAAPHRYPGGDVRYLASTDFLRFYHLGMAQARVGQFDDAVRSLESGIAARRTTRARLALIAARLCRSSAGRNAFDVAKTLWKGRPMVRRLGKTRGIAGSSHIL